MGILTIILFDSLLFLNVGIILLEIACFSILQLHQYKIGKLFAMYALMLGISISLAPCNWLNEYEKDSIYNTDLYGTYKYSIDGVAGTSYSLEKTFTMNKDNIYHSTIYEIIGDEQQMIWTILVELHSVKKY